jgi:gp16 family phage-associated protein
MTRQNSKRKPSLRTPEQAKQWLKDNGISIAQFARDNDLDRSAVVDLLRGKLTGNFGNAHKAAVALGLKLSPNSATKSHVLP